MSWKPLNETDDFANPIPVHYNAVFGAFMGVAALFILSVGLLISNPMSIGLGAMNGLLALGFLFQPWFVVEPGRIGVRNLLGMTLKSHDFETLADFEVRGRHLHWRADGKKVKGVGGFLVRGSDWDRLAAAVARAS